MKKKLIVVIQHLTIGGSQTSLVSALNAIDYDKYDVTLYSREKGCSLAPQINRNVHLIVNDDRRHYYIQPVSFLMLCAAKVLRITGTKSEKLEKKLYERIQCAKIKNERKAFFCGERYDVAVAYMQGNTARFVDEGIGAKRKIVFFHGSIDEKHELHEKVFSDFDTIVGVSELVSDFLKETYPDTAQKVVTLENYVDAAAIRRKAEEYRLERRPEFTICTVGRIAVDKILDRAVRAARIVKDRGFCFHWYFVGDGPYTEEIGKLILENELSDMIELTGAKDNPFPYYLNSDAFVICSDDEALPMTMIEAKILSLPIISTKTSGGYSLVEHGVNGELVDFTDEALAEAIIRFISLPGVVENYKKNLDGIDYSKTYEKYRRQLMALLDG